MQYIYLGGLVKSLYWLLSIWLVIVIIMFLGGVFYEREEGEAEAVKKALSKLFWVGIIIVLILVFLPSNETMQFFITTKYL